MIPRNLIATTTATLIITHLMFPSATNARELPLQLAEAQLITSGELVRVKKLTRDMKNVRESISTQGPSAFQDPRVFEKYKKRFQQFTTAIKRYGKYGAPEVKTAQKEYLKLRETLSTEFKRAQGQKSQLGDVQARLKQLEARLFSKRAPKPLMPPFSDAQASAWVKAATEAKSIAQKSLKELKQISTAASLEKNNPGTVQQGAPYDMQDINRLTRFANKTIQQVNQAQKATIDGLKTQIGALDSELDYYRKLDPDNETDRANAFLSKGAPERIQTYLDDKKKVAMSAVYFLSQFGKKPNAKTQSIIDDISRIQKKYSKDLEIAAGASKLPVPASTDPALLAIAKEVIEKKRYGFGQHGPIVLTTKGVINREREESEEKFTDVDVSLAGDITLHGTKTTWQYKWKEFKFATPVKSDTGEWYIWWITARNYSSGGSHTPINEWVAGKSSQGSLIRKENFL